MSSTDPELEQGDQAENPADIWDGELAQNLQFFFWEDDGDNVYETGEEFLTAGSAFDAIGGLHYALADSNENNVGGEDGFPLEGSHTYHIGKFWCYGSLESTPVTQDDQDNSGPDQRGPGFTCDGSGVDNMSQTDNVMADISFYAEQSRNNGEFVCESFSRPTEFSVLDLENKAEGTWEVIVDDTYGTMVHSASPTFHGTVVAQGLVPNANYQITLNGPGSCSTTDDNLAGFGANLFQSGYWTGGPGLSGSCSGPGEGIYNMNLVSDEYTVMADSNGEFNYAFNLALPSGTYSGVKVLVKKTLDPFVSPWADPATVHTTNLFETAPITFTVD